MEDVVQLAPGDDESDVDEFVDAASEFPDPPELEEIPPMPTIRPGSILDILRKLKVKAGRDYFKPPKRYRELENSLSVKFVKDLERGLLLSLPWIEDIWLRFTGNVTWLQAPSLRKRQEWMVSFKQRRFIIDVVVNVVVDIQKERIIIRI